ncbi:MAG: CarD family transcriptional regulator [Proteobacteria bacterium]|nr:CarD family transcriptional regulator [Pseudomonadota bacterium]
MFSQGDKAFYPNHGVGVIEKITKNGDEHFYVIKILDSGMTVMVPVSKAKDVGLRPIIGKDLSEKVFENLKKSIETKNFNYRHQPWNRRQRDYMAKLKTGSIFDTVEIFKELTILQKQKPLSFGEKKLYDHVKKLLVKELACCNDCSEDAICSKINSLLSS